MLSFLARISVKACFVLGALALGCNVLSAAPINCSTVTTVGDAVGLAADGCINQDKIYSGFTTGTGGGLAIPSDWSVGISFVTLGSGADVHTINVSQGSAPALGAGTYTFNYEIAIDPSSATYASNWITQVQVSADFSDLSETPANSDTKLLLENGAVLGSVTSVNGVTATIGVDTKLIDVQETIVVDSSGLLHSFTDEFIETRTPEPSAMALIGGGLLVLGGMIRRSRRIRA